MTLACRLNRAVCVIAVALGVATFVPQPVPAAPGPPVPKRIELKTADGLTIAGFWLDAHGTKGPAMILLHNSGRDHYPYRVLWEHLLRQGVSVLAIDFRGHGASQRTTPAAYEKLLKRDQSVYADFIQDARAGLAFLTRVQHIPLERIAVVGGEVGATVGFQLCAENPKLRGLVALSPLSNAYGLQTLDYARRFGKRPLLLISVKRLLDEGPQPIADALAKTATVQLEVYPGLEVRGVEMLDQPAAVERFILAWAQQWLPAGGPAH